MLDELTTTCTVLPSTGLHGELTVPGDKSISHRAILLASLADGVSTIDGFLVADDTLHTISAMRALGVSIDRDGDRVVVHGVGLHGLKPASGPIDCGNSGTTMRLLAGILAAQPFQSVLVGDASLSRRPMARIAEPLREMGVQVDLSEGACAPITLYGNPALKAIQYSMAMASGQVKGCVLLAGLYAEGKTSVRAPAVARDHTERMLEAMGCPIKTRGNQVSLTGQAALTATDITVPGDISSAAFLMIAASIVPASDILIRNVGMNSTRLGVLHILRIMGADIEIKNETHLLREPQADIGVRSAALRGVDIPVEYVSKAIDEFPALFIAAACAAGVTTLRGAEELRVKETDRLSKMGAALQQLGIAASVLPDGMTIKGGAFEGGEAQSSGDHRIAMALSIAGLVAKKGVRVSGAEAMAVSYPDFITVLQRLGAKVEQ